MRNWPTRFIEGSTRYSRLCCLALRTRWVPLWAVNLMVRWQQ